MNIHATMPRIELSSQPPARRAASGAIVGLIIRCMVRYTCIAGIGILGLKIATAQPKISAQPKDLFLDQGKAGRLSVQAVGLAPITYQWLRNGQPMADATNNYRSVSQADTNENGDFSVIVSDSAGSITSRVARLKVFVPIPHGFGAVKALAGGVIDIVISGENRALHGQYFDLHDVLVSSNLINWAPFVTLERTNAALTPLILQDANLSGEERRFYRTPTNSSITLLPPLTGPYRIGTFSRLLTDSARTNTVRHTNHQFMITCWYPAQITSTSLRVPYVDSQMVNLIAPNIGFPNFSAVGPALMGHSISNAPVATNNLTWPVVLYSPSADFYRKENVYKEEELASHGFIVIGLDHRDTFASVFPDGAVVSGQLVGGTLSQLLAALNDRVADERFVMDRLAQWNLNDPLLSGRFDLEHIGAFGWSLGGATAAETCRQDSRCKAGINMDGGFFLTNQITTPFLMLHSDTPDLTMWGGALDDRRRVIREMSHGGYIVTVSGTIHPSYSDMPLIDEGVLESDPANQPLHPFIPGLRINQISSAYVVSFFQKYLRGIDDHLLDGPPSQFQEVIEFFMK